MKCISHIVFRKIGIHHCFLNKNKVNGRTTDSILNQLLAINESHFVNKPLDSIIAILPAGYTSMKVFGIRNTARFLLIHYPNKVWIELHVKQFSHMNPVDPDNIWNITLMRKENLYKVSIYQGTDCYTE